MADLEVQGQRCFTDIENPSLTNTHSSEPYPVEYKHTHTNIDPTYMTEKAHRDRGSHQLFGA